MSIQDIEDKLRAAEERRQVGVKYFNFVKYVM